MIERPEYLNKLISWQDKDVIKIITGIRRCGKSTVLKLFCEYLKKQGVEESQIISINFEDMDYAELRDYRKMHQYITDRMMKDKMNYIILDEIQNVDEYQRAVDNLYVKENTDIYITGSNAYLLSGELATLLSGRYVEIKMQPLCFREYCEFRKEYNPRNDEIRLYQDYVTFGGFPYTLMLSLDKDMIRDYLMGIYNTVVLKDIMMRKKISDASILESITKFLLSNIGSYLSVKKISDTLTSDGRKVTPPTVDNDLAALVESYMFHRVSRYDVRGKRYLKTQDKYYAVDMGLRFFLLGSRTGDSGHLLENVIYLELLRRGYEIYVGKIDALEIDFVTIRQGELTYYQVALTVADGTVLERELRPLLKVDDHYPKYLITMDVVPVTYHNGIKQIYALDFLLE